MAPNKVSSKVRKEAVRGTARRGTEVAAPVAAPVAGWDGEGRALCCVPQGKATCLDPPIRDLAAAVRVTCSNPSCPTSRLMHAKCFAKFEDKMCAALAKIGRGRSWTELQVRDNVWALGVKHSGYDMIYKFCCCSCGHGHLRGGQEQPVEEVAKGGKRRKEKAEKKPKLYCGKDKLSDKARAEGVECYGDWRCAGCGFVNYSTTPYSSTPYSTTPYSSTPYSTTSAGDPDQCGRCGVTRVEEEVDGGHGGVENRGDLTLLSTGNFMAYKKEKNENLMPNEKEKNKKKINIVADMRKDQPKESEDKAELPKVETDCEVVARRERQISHYRSSEEYQRCLELVGGREGEEELPRTPDTTLVCSRSRWDALVHSWRQAVRLIVREKELELERMEEHRRAEEDLASEKKEKERIQKHKIELAKMEQELEQARREMMEQKKDEEQKRMEEQEREVEERGQELAELEQVVEEARASEWMLLQEVEGLRRQLRLAEEEREQEEEKVRVLLAEKDRNARRKKVEVEGGWSCGLCTFLNPGEGRACSMCATARQGGQIL